MTCTLLSSIRDESKDQALGSAAMTQAHDQLQAEEKKLAAMRRSRTDRMRRKRGQQTWQDGDEAEFKRSVSSQSLSDDMDEDRLTMDSRMASLSAQDQDDDRETPSLLAACSHITVLAHLTCLLTLLLLSLPAL